MTFQEIHDLLKQKFGAEAVPAAVETAKDPWIEVAPARIADVCRFLKDSERTLFTHLNDLCGADYCEPDAAKAAKYGHEPHVEVVYHLSSLVFRRQLVLKVKLPRWKDGKIGEIPEVPSVSGVWGIAEWHEREAYDLVGIRFVGHPHLVRILCPEDWVGHPLRKDYDFPLEYHGVRGK